MSRAIEGLIKAGPLPGNRRKIIDVPPVRPVQLLGKTDFGEIEQEKLFYMGLLNHQTWPSLVNYQDGTTEYNVVGPPLNPYDISILWYFSAKDKSYGLDTDDVLDDADSLKLSYFDDLRELHQKIPGWDLWYRPFMNIVNQIQAHREEYAPAEGKVYLPLMRWRKDLEGRRQWVFGLEPGQLATRLKDRFNERSVKTFNSFAGISFMWALSQDLVELMPDWVDFSGQSSRMVPETEASVFNMDATPVKVRSQVHGVLQSAGLNVVHVRRLLGGVMVDAYERYCDYEVYGSR